MKPKNSLDRCLPCSRANGLMGTAAFSMTELLVVIGMIGLLVALVTPAVNSILTGRALHGAIERTWGGFSVARQQAVSKQTHVAMVLKAPESTDDTDEPRAFILMEARPEQTAGGAVNWNWHPASPWTRLPEGVDVQPGTDPGNPGSTGFHSSAALHPESTYQRIAASLPPLAGQGVEHFSFVVFHPDGTVDSASSIPFLEFKRLRVGAETPDSALMLCTTSGRARYIDYHAQ